MTNYEAIKNNKELLGDIKVLPCFDNWNEMTIDVIAEYLELWGNCKFCSNYELESCAEIEEQCAECIKTWLNKEYKEGVPSNE